MNKTELLDRCARSGEERTLLARVLDKLELAQNRGVPAHTPFLSPGERASVADLLSAWGRPRHVFFGGYPDAERTVCLFLPHWQEAEDYVAEESAGVYAITLASGNEPGLPVSFFDTDLDTTATAYEALKTAAS